MNCIKKGLTDNFKDPNFKAVYHVFRLTSESLWKTSRRLIYSESLVNRNHLNASHLWLQVEVKPYVLDDQLCDECQGTRCGGKFAPFFCANVTCLQYYCEYCWAAIHSRAGREFHKPLVKEGGDRPRHISFRWNWAEDEEGEATGEQEGR